VHFFNRIRTSINLLMATMLGGVTLLGCDRINDKEKSTQVRSGITASSPGNNESNMKVETATDSSLKIESSIDLSSNDGNVVSGVLKIEVVPEGYQAGDGPLRIALYDSSETFNKIELAKWKGVYESAGAPISMELTREQLSGSQIAIAIYQDSNSNEKLDKNAFGIPQELYGFSNNPKRGFGPPSFAEAAVPTQSETMTLKIKLR